MSRRCLQSATVECTEKASAPILRETMTIMVEGKPVIVYKDEIEKKLYESFNSIHLQFCT